MASNSPGFENGSYDNAYDNAYENVYGHTPYADPTYQGAPGAPGVAAEDTSHGSPFVPAYMPPLPRQAWEEDTQSMAQPVAPAPAPAEVPGTAPARGRHKMPKPRGGSMARSSAVLGVGMIAAVGASGMASAQDRPQTPISVPDVPDPANLPGLANLAAKIPGVDSLLSDGPGHEQAPASAQPAEAQIARSTADAGEALRARILQQAEHQQDAADESARQNEAHAAAEAHREAAAAVAQAHKEQQEQQARQAEAAAKEAQEAQEAQARSEAEQAGQSSHAGQSTHSAPETGGHAAAHGSYVLPVASYTLTAGFGQSGDMWSANHTGTDFAAPTGTPVKAVGAGTVTQAGWAGAYGYRIVLTLDDGTELWFCHLSSMVVTSGKVAAGDVIGRVGATGNVTGPHLHLEVRPGGDAPVDPLPWLGHRGLQP
ncbi:M23 family metallopeptidase [Streptomyces sp. NPDC049577]|uniref:M23 family metallopeptidase n=1 Tax=Streptomyces sp. NPDC049577 TaxID=3155153 RepID=UPI00341AC8C1